MKKLFLLSLSCFFIGNVCAQQQQLKNLAGALRALAAEFGTSPAVPPLPSDQIPAYPELTPEEIAKLEKDRPLPPVRGDDDTRMLDLASGMPLPLSPRDDRGMLDAARGTPLPASPRDGDIELPPVIPHTGHVVEPPPAYVLPPTIQTTGAVLPTPPSDVLPPDVQPQPDTSMHMAKTKEEPKQLLIRKKEITKEPQFQGARQIAINVPNGEVINAVIGILAENGNLVIWGPKLKELPQQNTFFSTGQFIYPSFDAIEHTKRNGSIEIEYDMYPVLINVVALKAQKLQFMSQLKDKIDGQIAAIKQAVKNSNIRELLSSVQVNIPQSIGIMVDQLEKGPLAIESIYPKAIAGEAVLAIKDVEKLLDDVEEATKTAIEKLVEALGALLSKKKEVFEQYIAAQSLKPGEQPNFNLLAKRWEKDSGYRSTRESLQLFADFSSSLKARLDQINNWAQLSKAEQKELKDILQKDLEEKAGLVKLTQPSGNSVKDRLARQKENKLLEATGSYYKNLQKELQETLHQQEQAKAAQATQQDLERLVKAETERQRLLEEQRRKNEAEKEPGAVTEEEWESSK
ncbi:MAG: hypothetical protein AB7F19_05360 [Candidatus Babeliales bacterium]